LRTKLPSASIDHWHPGLPEPTQISLDLSELFARAEALEDNASHKAEAMYRQILVEDPAYAHAYLNLGFMLCEAGGCESAVELYEDGVRFCPDDPLMHFNRAVAHEGTGDVEGAMHSYEDALRLQPDLLDAHRNAALLYADAGQKQMAIRHFNAYRRLRPGNQTGR
jgi:tetratricopeptide (TPR) repeat protein